MAGGRLVSCRGRLETDLFFVLQGAPGDGLILCLARDVLSHTYSVLQGTTWDRLILCLAGEDVRQTRSVSCRGRLETDLFFVLQGTTWDRLILCLAGDDLRQTYSVLQGICQLPAKANSSELITRITKTSEGVKVCTHVLTSTLYGSAESGSRSGRLIPDKCPSPSGTLSVEGSVGPRISMDALGRGDREKIQICSSYVSFSP